MTTTDLTARAMQLAEADLNDLRAILDDPTRVGNLITDGSMYSPSWRTLDGGFDLWNRLQILTPERAEDMQMAYEETLDAGTDALGLYWEDGCLWAPEEEEEG